MVAFTRETTMTDDNTHQRLVRNADEGLFFELTTRRAPMSNELDLATLNPTMLHG